ITSRQAYSSRWHRPSRSARLTIWQFRSRVGALAFQNPHDCKYCVPIPRRRRYTEQFVDLAEIADSFHVTAVHSEDELVFRTDKPHEPLPVWRKCDWKGRPDAAWFRQDAHESNDIRA